MYKADAKRHLLSNKVNPFVLIARIPAVKKKLEEHGVSLLGVTDKVWGDKRYGFSIMISGGGLVVILSFLTWGITTTSASLFDVYFYVKPVHVILYSVSSFLICHYTVFKGDKYLKYFKQFEKWSKVDKWKYSLLTLVFLAGSITFWLYSFRFLPKL